MPLEDCIADLAVENRRLRADNSALVAGNASLREQMARLLERVTSVAPA
jgi:hypothetical protein